MRKKIAAHHDVLELKEGRLGKKMRVIPGNT